MAHLIALGTGIGFDIRVGEQVGLEVAALVEAPAAGGALVGGLLHVQDAVDGQGAALAEALTALRTLERLLLAVDVPAEGGGEGGC